MQDQMPMFDDIPTPAADAPKKPRKKPVKRRKARKAVKVALPVTEAPAPKRRQVRKPRATNGHAGGRYTKAQYAAIGALVGMSAKERAAVFDIVKGLSK